MKKYARHIMRSPLVLGMLTLSLFLILATAFAQATTPAAVSVTLANFKLAASNPLVFAGLIVTIVADLRAWEPKINGKLLVTIIAVVAGTLLGIAYQLIGILAVAPFSTWQAPLGGAVYGAAMGIFARYGFNALDYLFKRATGSTANATGTGSGSGNSSTPVVPSAPSSPSSGASG